VEKNNINLDQEYKERNKLTRKKSSYTDLGVAFGVSFGFIVGLLFFKENLAVVMAIVATFGLIIGSIMDAGYQSR
jgi:uncharacterized membrane protein